VRTEVVNQELSPDFCWFYPRVAAIPDAGRDGLPAVVMTLQKNLAPGQYSGLWMMRTNDLGRTWTGPIEIPELAWTNEPDGAIVTVCEVTPGWHPHTRRVIAIGCTERYGRQSSGTQQLSQTAYSVYDPKNERWSKWQILEMPADREFHLACSASAQWLVQADGTLLLPISFAAKEGEPCGATVVQCAFDGRKLTYLKHGDKLSLSVERGLCEPSLVEHQGRYYLTLRNDAKGYVTVGNDGLNFRPIQPWTFDDDTELGSYNTQQHWLTHDGGLFLSYTRRGANNDHIPRNRAPLFLAQVDPERLCVVRKTEEPIIPERGAMLGNFGAASITPGESWVTDAEYLLNAVPDPRGADGSLFLARIQWSKPNK
jgi:hypothetical protein